MPGKVWKYFPADFLFETFSVRMEKYARQTYSSIGLSDPNFFGLRLWIVDIYI